MRYLVLLVLLLPLLSAEGAPSRRARSSDSSSSSNPFGKNVMPTVGLSFGESFVENQHVLPNSERLNLANLWVGAAFYPRTTVFSPFLAVGTELGVINAQGARARDVGLEAIPSLRLGLTGFSEAGDVTFPAVELYGIAGYRFVTQYRDWSPRVGVGFSLPIFAYGEAKFFESVIGLPVPILPWMVEFIYDASPRREMSFRLGYHI
jgi:hypothetical protein